jgi:hypothetical protein
LKRGTVRNRVKNSAQTNEQFFRVDHNGTLPVETGSGGHHGFIAMTLYGVACLLMFPRKSEVADGIRL